MNLKELHNRSVLLFGKSRAFSSDEFESQMKYHKINLLREYRDDIKIVVEGKMMTPYEQNASDELYEKYSQSLEFISIDVFEKELAKYIDDNTLLMSLKLSHDKERLKSFIQNSMIGDELFFKLLKMYSWSGEDFFENDGNRDVSAALILRFYENIERNHNVQYATTGIMHLVTQAKSTQLLKVISSLEPIKHNPKIQYTIAKSIYCDDEMQESLFKSENAELLEALSLNKNLKRALVEEFLKDERLANSVAKNITLTEELFELLITKRAGLALNESLTPRMQEELFLPGESEVLYALALNNSTQESILMQLLESRSEDIKSAVYANSSIPVYVLEQAYKNGQNYKELAKNESTPIEILYQLQLDGRYERAVKTNPAFGRHIQSENIGWEI